MSMRRFVILGVSCLFFCLKPIAIAADMLYLPELGVYADKSTLMIEWGKNEGNAAIKVAFGPGLAAKNFGVVYAEQYSTDSVKIVAAKKKLADVLNSKENTFSVHDHFVKRIELKFKKYVPAGNIE